MRVSIKEISGKTGYSLATVSNVLNGKAGVNAETAKQIMKIANEMGYLQSKKTKKIRLVLYKKNGKILDDTPFFSCLFEGIESACKENGMKLEINTLDERSSDYEAMLQEISRDASAGILLLATEMSEEDVRRFEGIPSPVIILDNRFDQAAFSSVSTENEKSSYQIVKYLYKNGHREIGFIQSKVKIDNFLIREKGYRQAMQDLGLPIREEYRVEISPSMEESYEDMKQYLKNGGKAAEAYFVVNDMIAFGVMKALTEAGYSIPQDISLVGFDDLPYSAVSSPALSTVHVFKEEMGKVGINMLANKITANLSTVLYSELGTVFVPRESVRKK